MQLQINYKNINAEFDCADHDEVAINSCYLKAFEFFEEEDAFEDISKKALVFIETNLRNIAILETQLLIEDLNYLETVNKISDLYNNNKNYSDIYIMHCLHDMASCGNALAAKTLLQSHNVNNYIIVI